MVRETELNLQCSCSLARRSKLLNLYTVIENRHTNRHQLMEILEQLNMNKNP